MQKTIQLRVKKEIDSRHEFQIMKFKGALITQRFTEIIHITDENENFYLNSFSIAPDNTQRVEDFVSDYISDHNLSDTITLIKADK